MCGDGYRLLYLYVGHVYRFELGAGVIARAPVSAGEAAHTLAQVPAVYDA
jgi:hypothetical protein